MIIQYLSTKAESYYRIFLGTFVINTILMVIVSIFMFKNPVHFYKLDIKFLMWIISGFVLFLLLFLKIAIAFRINKRSKDPAFYTINFFGKKVYEKGIVRQSEFVTLILSMPFFLIIGSYFVARLINIIMHGSF
ncbi:MAG: hypothetical protein FWG49_02275 [Leptospirales bacterium]|nr:hypothetical protein [Leptospirales bacterium]